MNVVVIILMALALCGLALGGGRRGKRPPGPIPRPKKPWEELDG